MARIKIQSGEEFSLMLDKLTADSETIAKRAIFEGSKVVTDEIRKNLESLPEDRFRHLKKGEIFTGVPGAQKKDLEKSLGITPIEQYGNGYDAHIGFDGYGSKPTKKYPKGVPNQLLARAVESGSEVRAATPFISPAIRSKRKEALKKMNDTVEEEVRKRTRKD